MLPETKNSLKQNFQISVLPSKTFKIHPDSCLIAGYVNELEAVKQAIYIILNVERYAYLIHSWNIGVELVDLIGQPVSFCLPEIKRRITEALLQDDRITNVQNFEFEVKKGHVYTTFEVNTIFGMIETEKVVEV